MNRILLTTICTLALSGCAICREHPTACKTAVAAAVAAAVIGTVIAVQRHQDENVHQIARDPRGPMCRPDGICQP